MGRNILKFLLHVSCMDVRYIVVMMMMLIMMILICFHGYHHHHHRTHHHHLDLCKATLGYFAMLVAMTYQVELFVSIISGRFCDNDDDDYMMVIDLMKFRYNSYHSSSYLSSSSSSYSYS